MDGFTLKAGQSVFIFNEITKEFSRLELLFKFDKDNNAVCEIPKPKAGETYLLAHTMKAAEKQMIKRLKERKKESKILLPKLIK